MILKEQIKAWHNRNYESNFLLVETKIFLVPTNGKLKGVEIMNFYGGIKSKDYFPWSEAVYDLKYLNTQKPNTNLNYLIKEEYGKNDPGNIQSDLRTLSMVDDHAKATNDFYNGGRLEYYMDRWMNLTKAIRDDKRNVDVSDIISNIVKYNDHLEERKRDYCAYELRSCCYDFNNSFHVKEEGYWDEYTKTVNGHTYKYKKYINPVYYRVDGFQNLKGKDVEKIVDLIKAVERESGISFLNPKDWKNKIRRC